VKEEIRLRASLIQGKIRTLTMTQEEYEKHGAMLKKHPQFLLWQQKDETGSASLPASTLKVR